MGTASCSHSHPAGSTTEDHGHSAGLAGPSSTHNGCDRAGPRQHHGPLRGRVGVPMGLLEEA
eukprot:6425775-Alexandrium_andersonii.AAC.1